jgi:hypothetical protein
VGPKGRPLGIDHVYHDHEERLEVGGQIGENVAYRQGSKEEKVFESGIQSVPDLWQTEGIPEEVRNLQDLLSGHGPPGRDPGRRQIELVKGLQEFKEFCA